MKVKICQPTYHLITQCVCCQGNESQRNSKCLRGFSSAQSLLLIQLTSAVICPSGPDGHLSAPVILPFCLCCGTQLCSPSPFHGSAAPAAVATAAVVSQKLAGVLSPARLLSMSSSFGPLGHIAHFSNSCFGCYPLISQNLWHALCACLVPTEGQRRHSIPRIGVTENCAVI